MKPGAHTGYEKGQKLKTGRTRKTPFLTNLQFNFLKYVNDSEKVITMLCYCYLLKIKYNINVLIFRVLSKYFRVPFRAHVLYISAILALNNIQRTAFVT